ncbi:MAG: FecR domain-containing protein [Gemmatimonadota bacterium]
MKTDDRTPPREQMREPLREQMREFTPEEIEAALAADPEVTLITDYLSRSLTTEQMLAVNRRLDDDAGFRARMMPILTIWNAWPTDDDFDELAEEEEQDRWPQGGRSGAHAHAGPDPRAPHASLPSRDLRQLRRWQLAAGVVFAALVASNSWTTINWKPWVNLPADHVAEAPANDERIVRIDGGSTVSLKAGARLAWHDRPSDSGFRELLLVGSAYFDLRSANIGEFILITPAARIVVTGTSTSVDVNQLATTLITVGTGSVMVEGVGVRNNEPLHVGPGDVAQVSWGQLPRRAR